jgi:hypothetical protein
MTPKPIDMEQATLDGIIDTIDSKSCYDCDHFDFEEGICTAYPEYGDIPTDFLTGDREHTKAEPGDNGIRFKAKK